MSGNHDARSPTAGSTGEHRTDEERTARNEAAFREANEQLEQTYDQSAATGAFPFLCECANPQCTRALRLTLDEYREVRAHPARFVVLPGHELPSVGEVVVEQGDGYLIVEKSHVGGLREP